LTKWAGLGSSLRPGTEGNTQYEFFLYLICHDFRK
jgi:hypothetical protein